MSKKILVYGAGAIGRGYVPWLFKQTDTKLYFVEKNKNLREKLLKFKKYNTYMTTPSGYNVMRVNLRTVSHLEMNFQ